MRKRFLELPFHLIPENRPDKTEEVKAERYRNPEGQDNPAWRIHPPWTHHNPLSHVVDGIICGEAGVQNPKRCNNHQHDAREDYEEVNAKTQQDGFSTVRVISDDVGNREAHREYGRKELRDFEPFRK